MEEFLTSNIWILIILLVWVLPWKGYALWQAARLSHKWWFITILVINTFAILDIIYIFFVARKHQQQKLPLWKKGDDDADKED